MHRGRRSQRPVSGIGAIKTKKTKITTKSNAIYFGPVSVLVRGDAEVRAACTQSNLCQRLITTAVNASLQTYAATSDTRAAQRAGMRSLQNGRRHARDSQQSRTASALTKVVANPSLLRIYAWTQHHGTRERVRLHVFAPTGDDKANSPLGNGTSLTPQQRGSASSPAKSSSACAERTQHSKLP